MREPRSSTTELKRGSHGQTPPDSDRRKGSLPYCGGTAWCSGQLAEDASGVGVFPTASSAVKRCGLGAVITAAYQLTHDYDIANELAHNALRPRYGVTTLVHVNDLRGHSAVLALFDEVISARR